MDISCPSHLVYFNHNNKHLKGEKNYGEVLSGKSIWKGKVEEENHVEEEIRRINEENGLQ